VKRCTGPGRDDKVCARRVHYGGLCAGHAGQRRRGVELAPLRPQVSQKVTEDGRWCPRCQTRKEDHHFDNDATRVDGKYPVCRPCVRRDRQVRLMAA
jgi:hypothetical protein